MDLKKGLTYTAFGFLFTLIDFNLTVNGEAISVTPDFIGWILFFLAYEKMGDYFRGKPYMKWIPLVMAVLSAAIWGFGFVSPDKDLRYLKSAAGLLDMIYIFFLLTILARVADDHGSSRGAAMRKLRWVFVIAELVMTVIGFLAEGGAGANEIAVPVVAAAVAVLIAAIMTAVTLFGLRKEIQADKQQIE